MRMAARLDSMGQKKYKGLTRKSGDRYIWTGKLRTDENALRIPFTWKSSKFVFVNSMSDLFHESVPVAFISRVWSVMELTQQHTYQILTKRPERMVEILSSPSFQKLDNVWLGTSVESSDVLHRIDSLRKVPASIRFVSFEPLLGSVSSADMQGIDWAIVGGESGPKSRAVSETWIEEIEKICRMQKAAFFFKQWGGVNKKLAGRTFKGRTFDEMPAPRPA